MQKKIQKLIKEFEFVKLSVHLRFRNIFYNLVV